MLLEFSKEMPKQATRLTIDFSSLAGPLFFEWVVALLFPVSGIRVDNNFFITRNWIEYNRISSIP
jgi:hypothetical protein